VRLRGDRVSRDQRRIRNRGSGCGGNSRIHPGHPGERGEEDGKRDPLPRGPGNPGSDVGPGSRRGDATHRVQDPPSCGGWPRCPGQRGRLRGIRDRRGRYRRGGRRTFRGIQGGTLGEKSAAIGHPAGPRAPVSNDGRCHGDSGGEGVPISERGTILLRMDGGRSLPNGPGIPEGVSHAGRGDRRLDRNVAPVHIAGPPAILNL